MIAFAIFSATRWTVFAQTTSSSAPEASSARLDGEVLGELGPAVLPLESLDLREVE